MERNKNWIREKGSYDKCFVVRDVLLPNLYCIGKTQKAVLMKKWKPCFHATEYMYIFLFSAWLVFPRAAMLPTIIARLWKIDEDLLLCCCFWGPLWLGFIAILQSYLSLHFLKTQFGIA